MRTATRLGIGPVVAGLLVLAAGCGGAGADASTASDAGEAACESPVVVSELPPLLYEASGVASDPGGTGRLWAHNDSENPAELFALDSDGSLVATLPLVGGVNRDFEDVAAGSCDGRPCLYLADIGDNLAVYPWISVYRIPLADADPDSLRPSGTWRFVYPGGPRDAESLAVDRRRGELVILTKGREGSVELYAARLEGLRDAGPGVQPDTLRRIGRLPLPIGDNTAQFVTAADLSPDGSRLAVRSYSTIYLFDWQGTATFDTASVPRHSPLIAAFEAQGEGLAWEDDETLVLVSEGRGARPPTLSRIRCPS